MAFPLGCDERWIPERLDLRQESMQSHAGHDGNPRIQIQSEGFHGGQLYHLHSYPLKMSDGVLRKHIPRHFQTQRIKAH